MQGRLAGVFEEALVNKVGPGPAAMDPVLILAAFFQDWGNATVLLNGSGALITGASSAESAAKARGQGEEDKGVGPYY